MVVVLTVVLGSVVGNVDVLEVVDDLEVVDEEADL